MFQYALIALIACSYALLATRIGLDVQTSGPDELMRSLIPRCIINGNLLPSGYDACATYHWGYWSYAFYPQILASYLSALFMFCAKTLGLTAGAVFVAGRMASVVFSIITLAAIGATVSFIFRARNDSWILSCIAVLLLGCWPQFAFLSSYMNNDIVAFAGAALLTLALTRGIGERWNTGNTAILCLGVIITALGYWNAYGFILVAVPLFIGTVIQQNRDRPPRAVRIILAAFCVCAACVLPFFIANLIRYHDLIGMSAFHARYQQWLDEGNQVLQQPWTEGLKKLALNDDFTRKLMQSSIAMFGYMYVPMPNIVYVLYTLIAGIGIGSFLAHSTTRLASAKALMLSAAVATACLVTVALFLFYVTHTDYQPPRPIHHLSADSPHHRLGHRHRGFLLLRTAAGKGHADCARHSLCGAVPVLLPFCHSRHRLEWR